MVVASLVIVLTPTTQQDTQPTVLANMHTHVHMEVARSGAGQRQSCDC